MRFAGITHFLSHKDMMDLTLWQLVLLISVTFFEPIQCLDSLNQ